VDLTFQAQGGLLVRDVRRPDPATVALFRELPTSILSDCLDRFNVFGADLRPVGEFRPFAGPAITVEEIEGGNLMSHLALKYVRPGDVLVIDAKGVTTRACWGGLQTFAAAKRGIAGVVVFGAIRDASDVPKYGVPVYCRATSPAGPHKGWGGRVNVPIACGGATVSPGDLIVGDADGLVVVPRDSSADVAQQARQKLATEREWFARVEAGEHTADFLGLEAAATKLGIKVV
jgi:regulator of RNase E activity RraA